jgi:hypothetical protein
MDYADIIYNERSDDEEKDIIDWPGRRQEPTTHQDIGRLQSGRKVSGTGHVEEDAAKFNPSLSRVHRRLSLHPHSITSTFPLFSTPFSSGRLRERSSKLPQPHLGCNTHGWGRTEIEFPWGFSRRQRRKIKPSITNKVHDYEDSSQWYRYGWYSFPSLSNRSSHEPYNSGQKTISIAPRATPMIEEEHKLSPFGPSGIL